MHIIHIHAYSSSAAFPFFATLHPLNIINAKRPPFAIAKTNIASLLISPPSSFLIYHRDLPQHPHMADHTHQLHRPPEVHDLLRWLVCSSDRFAWCWVWITRSIFVHWSFLQNSNFRKIKTTNRSWLVVFKFFFYFLIIFFRDRQPSRMFGYYIVSFFKSKISFKTQNFLFS